MKNKALSALIIVFLLLLSACTRDTAGFFDYQKAVSRLDGILCFDGCEYGVIMEFKNIGEETLTKQCRRIEYTSPKEVSGLVFERTGDGVTAALPDISIPADHLDCERIFFLEKLFSLNEEDLYSISAKKDGTTVGQGKNGECMWQVTTGKDGLPTNIVYEGSFGEIELKIEKLYQQKQ